MARHRRFKFCAAKKKKLNTLASGYQDVRRTVSRPTSLVFSCDPPQNWAAHGWAVQLSELPFKILDENVETTRGHISISTMHLSKGLEFRAVVVMACDDEIIPLQERIETVGDDADLQEVYDTERHLLYVVCTRARDHLLVTSVTPASEFLDDMQGAGMAATQVSESV